MFRQARPGGEQSAGQKNQGKNDGNELEPVSHFGFALCISSSWAKLIEVVISTRIEGIAMLLSLGPTRNWLFSGNDWTIWSR